MKENRNTTFQNLWNIAKAVKEYRAVSRNKKNLNLTLHLKELEKEKETELPWWCSG